MSTKIITIIIAIIIVLIDIVLIALGGIDICPECRVNK